MTWSARPSTDGGIVSPRAFAVLRLIKLELRRLLDGQVARLRALEDFATTVSRSTDVAAEIVRWASTNARRRRSAPHGSSGGSGTSSRGSCGTRNSWSARSRPTEPGSAFARSKPDPSWNMSRDRSPIWRARNATWSTFSSRPAAIVVPGPSRHRQIAPRRSPAAPTRPSRQRHAPWPRDRTSRGIARPMGPWWRGSGNCAERRAAVSPVVGAAANAPPSPEPTDPGSAPWRCRAWR